ncbi:helix-turn-helix transcriptional regulator [Photobacterium sagamiensis]|uniref:AraC family transcriptional regulator n=1 Tax=Photobacterium sagamiensis TaxID=2910241 RepID=UPI003D12F163
MIVDIIFMGYREIMLKVVNSKIVCLQYNKLKGIGLSDDDIDKFTGLNHVELFNSERYIDGIRQNKLTQLLVENNLQHPRILEHGVDFILDDFRELAYVFNGPTLRDCLMRFIQYRTIIGNCDDVFLIQQPDGIALRYISDSCMPGQDFRALANFVIIILILRSLSPKPIQGLTVSLAFKKLDNLGEYSDFFATAIKLNCSKDEIFIPTVLLYTASEQHNSFLDTTLKHIADEKIISINSRFKQPSLKDKLYRDLKEMVHVNSLHNSLELICKLNNCSRWTLNRKLSREGVKFQDLLRAVRVSESRNLLRETNKPIIEISDMLGFNSQSSFNRFVLDNLMSSPTKVRNELVS